MIWNFDDADDESPSPVQKTVLREVVTLRFGRMPVREVIRKSKSQNRSAGPALADLVPPGGSYGYDLICHVGVETFLKGRLLQDVAWELAALEIPLSSFFDLQHKFLFYLGHLHRQAARRLRPYFQQQGNFTYLIDGTVEPPGPVHFGVQHASTGILLSTWKIATENAEEIAGCLREAGELWGIPEKVIHDLSDAMQAACAMAFPGIPHGVCHFHLVRDIGSDLCEGPQTQLGKRERQLKLKARLKEQRRGQTKWLRENDSAPLMLCELLAGKVEGPLSDVLGREILLAFHQWILDYSSDGSRQGFPFDPYLLYFHRRVVKASAAVRRLLDRPSVKSRAPMVLVNFSRMLQDYLNDQQVITAAANYEAAYELFGELRAALRLAATEDQPLSDSYQLNGEELQEIDALLQSLRDRWQQQAENASDPLARERYETVVAHLDRYWSELVPEPRDGERTTNGLERHWRKTKRGRRKTHGRQKVTRDFASLPAEYMLVPNLEKSIYVDLVLGGDLSNLASRMAEVCRTAGALRKWKEKQKPLNVGRIPQRLLRTKNFVDNIVDLYTNQCETTASRNAA